MRLVRALVRDDGGVSVVEFALIAPVMLMTLFGMFDIGHGMYTKSLLYGAIEKSARNSTIEGVTPGSLDARVTSVVRQIAPGATLTFVRTSYTNFADLTTPEDFTDANSNNSCDNGEAFEDANGNGAWDADRGRNGVGGARDAVLYNVTVAYPRLFPIARLVGQSNTMSISTAMVLRNQPYGMQSVSTAIGNCP